MRVVIDADGYRERRAESLRADADEAAEEALRSGEPVELDPMPPSERRIVHEYLRERGGVETHSEGDEPERYLVVSPLDGLRRRASVSRETILRECRRGRDALMHPCGHGAELARARGSLRPERGAAQPARGAAGGAEADEHAPTAVRARQQRRDVHLADSLVGAGARGGTRRRQRSPTSARAPGFPGLALAVALPGREVRLVESQRRKCEFLERVCAAAGVENARVVCDARGGVARGRGRATTSVVAARSRPQPVVLEYAAPLLRLGGALVDWRGRARPEEEARPTAAAAELGLRRWRSAPCTPFEGASEPHLHVFVKVAETPERCFRGARGWLASARSGAERRPRRHPLLA